MAWWIVLLPLINMIKGLILVGFFFFVEFRLFFRDNAMQKFFCFSSRVTGVYTAMGRGLVPKTH